MMQGRLAVLLVTTAAILGGCTAVDDIGRKPNYQVGYLIAPMPGETLESVAQRFNVPSSALIAANHLQSPYTLAPGQTLVIPPPATYVVRDGDSVEGIATNLGVDEASLAEANGLERPYHMTVGQVLHVPGGYGAHGAGSYAGGAAETVAPSVTPHSAISAQPLAPPGGGPNRPGPMGPAVGARPLPPPPPAYVAPPPPPPQARTVGPSTSQTALAPPPTSSSGPTPIAPPPRNLAPPPTVAAAAPPPLAPPPSTAGGPHFLKPVVGSLIEGFGASNGGQTNDGINIAAASGTPVKASEAGTVIYTGNELAAFGNLVLIRHAGGWVTAYGHLATIGVQKGSTVIQGQSIGTVGQTGSASTPQLHFEIRQGSKPVDPAPFLKG